MRPQRPELPMRSAALPQAPGADGLRGALHPAYAASRTMWKKRDCQRTFGDGAARLPFSLAGIPKRVS